ncbi:MAG: hypothetical protein EXR92_04150 [Gemmatimonadetes bacterium]|nr:hypothetical protein [Gemmatimonadota bacterium]
MHTRRFRRTSGLRLGAATLLLVTAWFARPGAAVAQSPIGAEGSGLEIQGPPPPEAPEVMSRDAEGNTTIRAVRVSEPLRIDGVLDEPFYQNTKAISDFIQTLPDEGAEPTELTEAWVGFDDDNVYISARAWDSAPESEWVANEMRRDGIQLRQNDQFAVMLDTYYDRRNGFLFFTNPLGAYFDTEISNEGSSNPDWNTVYDLRTGRFEGGWTVEMAIPFKSLRYRAGQEVWGINLRRIIRRKNEWDHLTFIPLSIAGAGPGGMLRISMAATLVGLETPPSGRDVAVKPYVTSGLRTNNAVDPAVSNDGYADIGLDVKYGIRDNLTADFTYNADFAQVEVDEQQVNLTRFSLSFLEKREFFLEGRGIFAFGIGSGGGGGVGAATGGGGAGGAMGGSVAAGVPTLFYSREIGLYRGQPVPILGGGRLTGKVGSFDVGALNIQTDDRRDTGAESTNFTVLRVRKDLLARSSVGVLFANRSQARDAEMGSNQTYGLDGSFAYENLNLFGYVAGTHTDGTRTDGLTGDDQSYRGQLMYTGATWGANVGHLFVGDDFNPEVGFLRQRGFRQSTMSARYSPRPASIEWARQFSFQGGVEYLENVERGVLEARDQDVSLGIEFESSDVFSSGYTQSFERLFTAASISGTTIPAGDYSTRSFRVGYLFGSQRRFSGSLSYQRADYYAGDRTSVAFSQGRIEVTPQFSIEPSLTFNWVSLPQGDFDQHVAVTRATYTLTPRMYVSGLVQYNAGTDAFSTNFRLRWEWAPGSELFLVYTEERDTDVLDRWSELTNRGLALKVTRLLRF